MHRKTQEQIDQMSDQEILDQFRRFTNGNNYIAVGAIEAKRLGETNDVEVAGLGKPTIYQVWVTVSGVERLYEGYILTERNYNAKDQARYKFGEIQIGDRVVIKRNGQIAPVTTEGHWFDS